MYVEIYQHCARSSPVTERLFLAAYYYSVPPQTVLLGLKQSLPCPAVEFPHR